MWCSQKKKMQNLNSTLCRRIFLRLQVTGCSSEWAGAFGPTQDLNPCLLCLLHGQSGSLPLVLPGKPKYHNGNLYLWLRVHKTYAILSTPQECDVTRAGVIITDKPKNWGSSASFIHQPQVTQWLAGPGYKSVSSLQGSLQSLEPSLFTPAWTFCWTVHWIWFSELDCRMERVFRSTVCKSDNIWMSISRGMIK